MSEPERLILHLRAMPSAIPASVRFRRALKALLRVYRLRCERIEPAPAAVPAAPAGSAMGPLPGGGVVRGENWHGSPEFWFRESHATQL